MNSNNILPSLSWNKNQLNLYFDLVNSKDAILAYYWTTNNNLPAIAFNKKRNKIWRDKWTAKPCLVQNAKKIKNFNETYECTMYALHATNDPVFWFKEISFNVNFDFKLWVVAMHTPYFYEKIDLIYASQKRTIIGKVPENEFEKREIIL